MPLRRPVTRRLLATVLFTDIVGSTERAAELGDRAWRDLLERHHAVVRRELRTFHGREIDTAGDGFFALFEAPEAAVRCAESVVVAVRPLGLQVRAGVHTGEIEVFGDGVGGMAVHIGARVAALAGPSEVLVTGSVRDLMTGSDRHFAGGEPRELKGVAEPWPVYRLVPDEVDGEVIPAQRRAPIVPLYTRRQKRRLVAGLAGALVAALVIGGSWYAIDRPSGSQVRLSSGDRLDLVDLASAKVTEQVPLRDRPAGIAVGAGSLWVSNPGAGTVARIDARSHSVVDTIPVDGRPGGVVFAGGAVWVTDQSHRVLEINPDVDQVVHKVTVGNRPTAIAAGPSGVWVTNGADGTVTVIDPRRGDVVGSVDVGAGPAGLVVGATTVWVANSDEGTVTVIDAAARHVVGTYPVGAGPTGIARTSHDLWVVDTAEGQLARLDPVTGTVRDKVAVGNGPSAVVAAGGGVWVSDSYGAQIVHVDARHGRVDRRVRVGGTPVGLAVAAGRLWATAAAVPALHRGGTLRVAVESNFFPSSMDPVMTGTLREPQLVFDGLVAINRLPGVGGATLVPDLAIALPTPADDGRTYSFRLRSGIRYSTGAIVRASDFRRTFERMLTIKGAPFADYFTAVQGARHCLAHPATCDLSLGIKTDDETRTVTVHLARADPDFLYKLTLPVAAAVPPGTPPHQVATDAVPGTGPYRVANFVAGPPTGIPNPLGPRQAAPDVTGPTEAVLDLRRNPHFREWSRSAQPAGYPDRLVLRLNDVDHPNRALADVLARTTSLVLNFGVFPGRMADLHQHHVGQLHVQPSFLIYLGLDATRPPFNDVRARQALTLAVDQTHIRRLFGESGSLLATCQILPPGFPGYSPYCPYPPDLAKARRLAATTASAGTRVTLALPSKFPRLGRYLAGVLRSLGYEAQLRLVDDRHYFTEVARLTPSPQAVWFAFGPDYPAASNYLLSLVGCEAAHHRHSYNASRFCDSRVVQPTIQRALAAQQDQPAAAGRFWQQVDHAAADQAAILPWGYLTEVAVTAHGVGGYTSQPQYGVQLDQLWMH